MAFPRRIQATGFRRRQVAALQKAIAAKEAVWREGGYVSDRLWGHGVAGGLEAAMKEVGLL
jgi:hypothetical protein